MRRSSRPLSLWTRAHVAADRIEQRIGRDLDCFEREQFVRLFTTPDDLRTRRNMLLGGDYRLGVKRVKPSSRPYLGFVRVA